MAEWAALFDMDGVIVDTNPFHQEAWRGFCRAHHKNLSEADLAEHVWGRINRDILGFLFGQDISEAQVEVLGEAKEAMFRDLARGKLPPVAGLPGFLAGLQGQGIPMAVATSAPPSNVEFVMAETGLEHYFAACVDSTAVTQGKPAPDIYLAAAKKLGVAPERCVVFEDSLSGIQAGRNAGMAVVGVATTHSREELARLTDLCVSDFTQLPVDRVAALAG